MSDIVILKTRLSRTFEEYASAVAVSDGSESFLYADLFRRAKKLSDALHVEVVSPVGVYGSRSIDTLIAMLGVVFAGRPYVYLNPKFPADRLAHIIADAQAGAVLIVGADDGIIASIGTDRGAGRVEEITDGMRLVHTDVAVDGRFDWSNYAYLKFTSGSTGRPKGIGITHSNLSAYLDYTTDAFGMTVGDRASQLFELSFDLSVHDLFVTWLCGGELCLPKPGDLLAPGNYIVRNNITHWFSVPSVPSIMKRLGMLRPGAFPSIKQSLFCGEALPEETAALWAAAAPNSSLWNLYGPTEATIAFTAHEWRAPCGIPGASGTVSIGRPFPGQHARVMVAPERGGSIGELYLGGSQVAPGYITASESAALAFGPLPGSDGAHWYRTGDLVKEETDGQMTFIGRVDSQVQVMGHRVELGEVESVLRSISDHRVVAMCRASSIGSTEIIAFVENCDLDVDSIRSQCKSRLPDYMLPADFYAVPSFPHNSNGKIDRKHLLESIS